MKLLSMPFYRSQNYQENAQFFSSIFFSIYFIQSRIHQQFYHLSFRLEVLVEYIESLGFLSVVLQNKEYFHLVMRQLTIILGNVVICSDIVLKI